MKLEHIFWFQEVLILEEFEFLLCDFFTIFLKWHFVLFNPLVEKTVHFVYISHRVVVGTLSV